MAGPRPGIGACRVTRQIARYEGIARKLAAQSPHRKKKVTYFGWHGLVDGSPPVSVSATPLHGIHRTSQTYQMSFSDVGSLTILLSSGERPVLAPEYAVRAPVDVIADPDS